MKLNKTIARLQTTAMSFDRKKVKQKIQELAIPTYQHVVKIILFPTSGYVAGWEREIRAWYTAILKYSGSIRGKPLSQRDLAELLLEDVHRRNSVDNDIFVVKEANPELKPRDLDEGQVKSKVAAFYTQFAKDLYSQTPTRDMVEIFNVLKS
jgi:hypothetical protein